MAFRLVSKVLSIVEFRGDCDRTKSRHIQTLSPESSPRITAPVAVVRFVVSTLRLSSVTPDATRNAFEICSAL